MTKLTVSMQRRKRLLANIDDYEGVETPTKDMLDLYLESPPIKGLEDPLEYWNGQRATGNDGGLAQMALDYLSAPGE